MLLTRGAAKHPTVLRIAPRTTKSDPAPNANSAEVEKPGPGIRELGKKNGSQLNLQ